jgi:hypothetical protein
MFQTFGRSWELVKASFNVLRTDKELMVFPLVSMIGVILVTIVFSIPMVVTGILTSFAEGTNSTTQNVIGVALLFLFYLAMYTIIIYSNVALVGAAMMRLRGEDPSVGDGFRIAGQHMPQIFGYAAISATVGVVLSMLRDGDNIVGRIVAGLLSFAWNVVTFLAVPVLIIENVGPVDAIKRSGALLRKTWGEQLIANGGIGLVFGLITFAAILVIGVPLFALAVSAQSLALMITAVAVIILIMTLIGLFSSALNGVFQAALYNYASTGDPGPFSRELVAGAFKHK